MQHTIIHRLFASFSELEQAIASAKATLTRKSSVPEAVIARLSSYDTILLKQRQLAESLCVCIEKGDSDEVARHVSLINALSQMIRDDARAILSTLVPRLEEGQENESESEEKGDTFLC